MSILQKQADTAWYALFNIGLTGYCGEDTMDIPKCYLCPEPEKALSTCDGKRAVFLENWLRNNGFPVTCPQIHTAAELAQQLIKGRRLPCFTQWIAQNVEAVTCPDCGKCTLFRERRMVCNDCGSVYPADKWANAEPCDCGCMDARYFGVHLANRLGQLELQQCQTPGCRWGGDHRRLTVQELADAAQVLADEQWAAARTCPACGQASEECECGCGWRK
jgi:hypothetical protein